MYISLSLSSVTTFRSPVCPDIFTELTAKWRWRLIIMFCETLHKNNYENRKHILRSYAHCWWRHWHLRMLILHILIDRWMLLHVSATIYSCIQGALLYTKRLKLSIDETCSNSYLGMGKCNLLIINLFMPSHDLSSRNGGYLFESRLEMPWSGAWILTGPWLGNTRRMYEFVLVCHNTETEYSGDKSVTSWSFTDLRI